MCYTIYPFFYAILWRYTLQKLFSEALRDGTMEGYFKLGSHFQTQSEPAYCGLATLSMVLNSLEIDPGRKWKGIILIL